MVAYLDERTCFIIQVLLDQESAITITQLAEKAKISRRVVYYDLEKINDELAQAGIDLIENKQRVGIRLNEQQVDFLRELLKNNQTTYVFSTDERQLLMMFYIAVTSDRVTLEQLMEISQTSRNTTLNDVAMIREYLSQGKHKIRLEVTKKEGYVFKGNSLMIIEFLFALLTQMFRSTNEVFLNYVKEMLRDKQDDSGVLLSQDFTTALYHKIHDQTDNLGKTFVEKDLLYAIDLFPYFILALRNLESQQIEDDLKEVLPRLEYRIAMRILTALSQEFEVLFDLRDIYFMTLMLLSTRKTNDSHSTSPDYQNLYEDVQLFIRVFEQQAGLTLTNIDQLTEDLVTHIKALLYRKKFNVFTLNPLTDKIKQRYEELFAVVKLSLPVLERSLDIQLTDGEIAYIVVHFGGVLRQQKKALQQYRLVILTDESRSIQNLIVQQCQRYLQRLEIVAIVSRIEDVPAKGTYDFIVSTIKRVPSHWDVIVVNPIFQVQDIFQILRISVSGHVSNQTVMDQIDTCLIDYIPNPAHRYEASQRIQQIFKEQFLLETGENQIENGLVSLIDERLFDFMEEPLSEEAAAKMFQDKLEKDLSLEVGSLSKAVSIYPHIVFYNQRVMDKKGSKIAFIFARKGRHTNDKETLYVLLRMQANEKHVKTLLDLDRLVREGLMDAFREAKSPQEVIEWIKQKMV